MKEKQRTLLTYLLPQTTPVSARQLAEVLHVSIRTIKNYIYEINQLGEFPIIFSSNTGYSIDTKQAHQLLDQAENDNALPNNYRERSFFIIKRILIEHEPINLFDLSEELFVSYSTLKADISRMNKTYEKYRVKFVVKQDLLQIVGEEKEKRRLISYIIFEEVPYNFVNASILESTFAQEDITKLTNIIHWVLHNSNYRLNDFSFVNLMLHLLILIESVRNGKSLVSRNWFSSWLREDKAKLVTLLIKKIESDFDLTLNDLEKEEIHMIFQANANYIPSNNHRELEQIVGKEITTFVKNCIQDIQRTFGINLNGENFIVPFTLHLSALYSRAKQNTSLKNPMKFSLKTEFPLVYDIAIYIGLRFNSRFSTIISEDEIAYISLHIASELEGQKRNRFKIPTVLLCPKYMNLDEQLYNHLTHHFGNELLIQRVISHLDELPAENFDLLLTTIPLDNTDYYQVIQISPFFTEKQRLLITTELGNLRLLQKRRLLRENFDDYFNIKYFTSNLQGNDWQSVITEMCQNLREQDSVPEDFLSHVLSRESASSTAFESVAIPHSVYMDAHKTVISVAISRKGILWGDRKVHIVLLAAITDVDRHHFTDLYEALISLFDSPTIYQELKKIQDFEAFRNFIFQKSTELPVY